MLSRLSARLYDSFSREQPFNRLRIGLIERLLENLRIALRHMHEGDYAVVKLYFKRAVYEKS